MAWDEYRSSSQNPSSNRPRNCWQRTVPSKSVKHYGTKRHRIDHADDSDGPKAERRAERICWLDAFGKRIDPGFRCESLCPHQTSSTRVENGFRSDRGTAYVATGNPR